MQRGDRFMSKVKFTTGEISEVLTQRLGKRIALHRVLYAIRSRGIQPVEVVGRYRLFDNGALDRLACELS